MAVLANNMQHWQHRAAQMRRLAAVERDANFREAMERLALGYERLAERALTRSVSSSAQEATNEHRSDQKRTEPDAHLDPAGTD